MMSGDPRETILVCQAKHCRFNISTQPEPTCILKMTAIGDTGRCMMAEGRPMQRPMGAPAQKTPGRFEGGKWVE